MQVVDLWVNVDNNCYNEMVFTAISSSNKRTGEMCNVGDMVIVRSIE